MVSGNFVHDKTKEGYELLKNVGRSVTHENYHKIMCIRNEEPTDEVLLGSNRYLGQEDAEFLLQNQHLILRCLQPYNLLFPGTVWREKGLSRLKFMMLEFHQGDEGWHLYLTCNDKYSIKREYKKCTFLSGEEPHNPYGRKQTFFARHAFGWQ